MDFISNEKLLNSNEEEIKEYKKANFAHPWIKNVQN